MLIKHSLKKRLIKSVLLLMGLVIALTLYPLTKNNSNIANDQDIVSNSNILYFPTINPGKDWQTTISITNSECKRNQRSVNATLTAYDKHGLSLGVIKNVIRLRANKTKSFYSQTLPTDAESLRVESNGNLICNAIFKTRDGTKSEVVPAIKESSRQLDFPALLSYDDLYIYKTITLLNPNTNPASVDIVALDKDGYEIDRNSLPSLSSMESKTFSLVDIFGTRILKDLSTVRVNSDSNIIGLQLVDYPAVDLVGLPALATTSKGWTFPIATKGENFDLWTKVGILNPGNDIASVTMEAFDASNNSLGIIHSQTILPGVTYVINTANLDTIEGDTIPSNTAILKVASTHPVIGYEVIGVLNGSGLSAVTGIPDEDHTAVGFELIGSMDGDVLNTYSMVRMGDGNVKSLVKRLKNGDWSKDVLLETLLEQKIPKIETNAISSKKKVYLVPSIEDERMCSACGDWKKVCPDEDHDEGYREGHYQKIIAEKISQKLQAEGYDVKIFEGSNSSCKSKKKCGCDPCPPTPPGGFKSQSGIGKKADNAWGAGVGADVLVSFHTNADGDEKTGPCDGKSQGTITFYECEADEDKILANTIHNAVLSALESERNKRGIINADKGVVHWWTSEKRGINSNEECKKNETKNCETTASSNKCDYPDWYTTKAPACLIESLFHDNKEESAILRSDKGQNAIAQGIANGIIKFFGDSIVDTTPTPTITVTPSPTPTPTTTQPTPSPEVTPESTLYNIA